MSGRDKSAENALKANTATQDQITAQNQAVAQGQIAKSDIRMASADALKSPVLTYLQNAVTDPTKTMQVAASPLSNITRASASAKQNIMDSVPEGAARDAALAQAAADAPAQKAAVLNDTFLGSLQTILGAGDGETATALQQAAVAANFGNSATSSNQVAMGGSSTLMNAAQQRKAATMGALGQVAGMAGSFATAGMLSNGGGSKGTGK
jgi:hypothetical protein